MIELFEGLHMGPFGSPFNLYVLYGVSAERSVFFRSPVEAFPAVDHGRVRVQRHAEPQPVMENSRNNAAFPSPVSLPFL